MTDTAGTTGLLHLLEQMLHHLSTYAIQEKK